MSYKANLDIVISLGFFHTYAFRKQGTLRFRISIYQLPQNNLKQKDSQKEKQQNFPQYCHPYNILKKKDHLKTKENIHVFSKTNGVGVNHQTHINRHGQPFFNSVSTYPSKTALEAESYIDHDGQYYYSKLFQSKFSTNKQPIEQCCFFRTYIENQEMESTELEIKVELLFSPDNQGIYKQIGEFKARIHKLHEISTYLPIVFDEFQGFTVSGTYQSTIMEFKYEKMLEESEYEGKKKQKKMLNFENFQQYFEAVSNGVKRGQTRQFYEYYRKFLEKELFSIQEKHSDLMRVLNLNQNYGFIKVSPNQNFIMFMNCNLPDTHGVISRQKSTEFIQLNGSLAKQKQSQYSYEQIRKIVSDEIIKDFLNLKALIYQKWNEYILFQIENMGIIINYFKKSYDENVKERFKSHVFSHKTLSKPDWTYSQYQDSGKVLLKQAEVDKMKDKEEEMWRECFPINNSEFFQDQKKNIKIFEEICEVQKKIKQMQGRCYSFSNKMQRNHEENKVLTASTATCPEERGLFNIYSLDKKKFLTQAQRFNFQQKNYHHHLNNQFHSQKIIPQVKNLEKIPIPPLMQDFQEAKVPGQHIIVLVHGYQASRQDFILLKSCLEIRYECRVFISSSNEGRTQQKIETMGKRLAFQLTNYFKNIEFTNKTRLSFIGHSMGGIIIRSALSHIKNINQFLYTYMSFSSPHLGYLYEPSRIIQAGLWFLNTWQKSQSLEQLCMRESEDPRSCFLYKLTQNGSLDHFKHLAFISSSQDEYVPYQSARIQKNNQILCKKLGDCINRDIICEMVDNLLSDISCEQISRMNVVFNIEESNFDSIVGRTAHVKYLSDQKFIKMFCIVFDKFFK